MLLEAPEIEMPKKQEHIIKVFSGDWYVSNKPGDVLVTILGSCISACIRDPFAKVGGMNHFLLPGSDSVVAQLSDAARYGVHAMEKLINGILKMGGQRERLEVKVFGGGNVIKNSTLIGSKNAAFVRDFLRNEGLKITSEDLEGNQPRKVHYYPETGRVMLKKLDSIDDRKIIEEEARFSKKIISKPVEGDIDLF